jgi:hypothetical protein
MNLPKNPKSRKYKRIVNRGCGGTRDYWGEYDCLHKYDWTCDECPWRKANEKYIDTEPIIHELIL